LPNHVTTHLRSTPRVIDLIVNAEGEADFNKLVPMPEILRDKSPSSAAVDWAHFAFGTFTINDLRAATPEPGDAFRRGDYGAAAKSLEQSNRIRMLTVGPYPKDFRDDDFEEYLNCLRALKQTGFAYWYDWANENWGTKWNAYESNRIAPDHLSFQTAWSVPSKMLMAIHERLEEGEVLFVKYADEDFGANCGEITLVGGSEKAGIIKPEAYTPAAYRLALDVIYDGKVPEGATLREDGSIRWDDDDEDYGMTRIERIEAACRIVAGLTDTSPHSRCLSARDQVRAALASSDDPIEGMDRVLLSQLRDRMVRWRNNSLHDESYEGEEFTLEGHEVEMAADAIMRALTMQYYQSEGAKALKRISEFDCRCTGVWECPRCIAKEAIKK